VQSIETRQLVSGFLDAKEGDAQCVPAEAPGERARTKESVRTLGRCVGGIVRCAGIIG